jgi:hypothetical protein
MAQSPRANAATALGEAVNARARALVAELRAILGGLPRARAVNAHAGAWLQVYIAAVDDADVEALGAELGLDPPERVSYEGVSLYRAASSEATNTSRVGEPSAVKCRGAAMNASGPSSTLL